MASVLPTRYRVFSFPSVIVRVSDLPERYRVLFSAVVLSASVLLMRYRVFFFSSVVALASVLLTRFRTFSLSTVVVLASVLPTRYRVFSFLHHVAFSCLSLLCPSHHHHRHHQQTTFKLSAPFNLVFELLLVAYNLITMSCSLSCASLLLPLSCLFREVSIG